MRPRITIENLKKKNSCLYAAFDKVADLADYKAIFRLQAFSGASSNLNVTICGYCATKSTLTKKMEDFVNDPLNYNATMQGLIGNISKFKNIVIPHRDSDFVVDEKGTQETYFWINERIEITVEAKNGGFYLAKLNVDETSDSLIFHNGEDGWTEYTEETGGFSSRVAERYKEYLAEKQLLKD